MLKYRAVIMRHIKMLLERRELEIAQVRRNAYKVMYTTKDAEIKKQNEKLWIELI